MTYYTFRLLSTVVQLYWVLKHGTFLAQRWEADDDGVNSAPCASERTPTSPARLITTPQIGQE